MHFLDLATEVISLILDHLTIHETYQLRLTCMRLKAVVDGIRCHSQLSSQKLSPADINSWLFKTVIQHSLAEQTHVQTDWTDFAVVVKMKCVGIGFHQLSFKALFYFPYGKAVRLIKESVLATNADCVTAFTQTASIYSVLDYGDESQERRRRTFGSSDGLVRNALQQPNGVLELRFMGGGGIFLTEQWKVKHGRAELTVLFNRQYSMLSANNTGLKRDMDGLFRLWDDVGRFSMDESLKPHEMLSGRLCQS